MGKNLQQAVDMPVHCSCSLVLFKMSGVMLSMLQINDFSIKVKCECGKYSRVVLEKTCAIRVEPIQ